VSTAVELRFDVNRSALPPEVKARLLSYTGHRLIGESTLLIDSQEHRTQAQNRDAARARLVTLVELAFVRPKKRTATRPKAGARERRLTTKKHRSEVKRGRGRQARED
jgi:ribosome-associated protein